LGVVVGRGGDFFEYYYYIDMMWYLYTTSSLTCVVFGEERSEKGWVSYRYPLEYERDFFIP
jgi:hypothetical protein